jgi:ABC-type glycerol-3-phosphate transport system substrate-binding protein
MKEKIRSWVKTALGIILPVLVIIVVYRAAGLRRVDQFLADTLDPAKYPAAVDLINRTLVNFEFNVFHYMARHENKRPATGADVIAFEGNEDNYIGLSFDETVSFQVTVPESGMYNLYVRYKIPAHTLLPVTVSFYINGETPFKESRTLDLPLIFKDESKDYTLDRLGDEMLPPQIRVRDWRGQRLFDNRYTTDLPLLFYLEAGENIITLRNITRNEVLLSEIKLKPPVILPTHEEYISRMVALHNVPYDVNSEPFLLTIPSNMYAYTVTSDLGIGSWNDPSFARFDPHSRLINFVFWYLFGSEVIYEVEVPRAGFYGIAFHYINGFEEISCFHNITVNGEIPSLAFAAVETPATGMRMGNLEVLDDDSGLPLRVFLHEGINTVSIKPVRGPYAPIINDIETLLVHVGEFVLDIRRITGAEVDTNRTWRLTRYLPDTEYFLEAYQVILEEAIRNIAPFNVSGYNSDVLASLIDAVIQLRQLREFPDELPLHLEVLTGDTGSLMDNIAYSIEYMLYQDMYLSQVFVYNDYPLPRPNISVMGRVANQVHMIWLSFTSERFRQMPEPEALNVWVNMSPMHINTLQAMVDRDFTRRTGIEVRISLIPDMNRLVLANASGETPDVATGLTAGAVFNLSSRNALHPLSSQPDFWEVAGRFPPGALVSYVFNDNVFAVPDQINFNSLIYRTDVFHILGLDPPDTWNDVINILPELQRLGMDFYHPIAFADAFKGFAFTTPMIYQHGGFLYNENGLSTAITTPEAIAGIRFLSSLFTYHAVPVQVPSFFNSFRMNLVPIGIADNMTYNLIRNGAPELAGLWALAPNPGIRDENGEVQRWFVTESNSANIIFADSLLINESWEFIKWWTSADVQATFANTMQTMYGRSFMWFSSNIEALAQSPINPADLDVILESLQWLRTVPFTPGFYQLERSLSNIWNNIVFDGTPPRNAVDSALPAINRELVRKKRELGFVDNAGNLTQSYTVREIDWIIEMINRYGGQR